MDSASDSSFRERQFGCAQFKVCKRIEAVTDWLGRLIGRNTLLGTLGGSLAFETVEPKLFETVVFESLEPEEAGMGADAG